MDTNLMDLNGGVGMTGAQAAAGDGLYIFDVSVGGLAGSKFITREEFFLNLPAIYGASNVLEVRNGTNGQILNVYKTYTDASNYARLAIDAGVADAGTLGIYGRSAGTGTFTNVDIGFSNTKLLRFSTSDALLYGINLKPGSDNALDFGGSGARWKDGYFGGTVRALKLTLAGAGGQSASIDPGTYNGEVAIGSSSALYVNGNNLAAVLGSTSKLAWGSTTTNDGNSTYDLILQRDAANTLAQRNGTNAQGSRIYNTYTDASNYERISMGWASNIFTIKPQAAGTGTQRLLKFAYDTSGDFWVQLLNGGSIGIGGGYSTETVPRGSLGLNGFMAGSSSALNFSSGTMTNAGCSANFAVVMQLWMTSFTQSTHTIKPSAKDAGGAYTGDGHHLLVTAGKGAAGNTNGGNLTLRGGPLTGSGANGYLIMDQLPTAAAGLPTGALWNNSGVVTVA